MTQHRLVTSSLPPERLPRLGEGITESTHSDKNTALHTRTDSHRKAKLTTGRAGVASD